MQPSSASTATLSSDKRKIFTRAEIKAHARELLLAAQVSSTAFKPAFLLRHIHQLPLGTHCARGIGAKCLPHLPAHCAHGLHTEREITALAGWPSRGALSLLPGGMEPEMTHLAHLGANFRQMPSVVCREQVAARAIARAELPSRPARHPCEAGRRSRLPAPLPPSPRHRYRQPLPLGHLGRRRHRDRRLRRLRRRTAAAPPRCRRPRSGPSFALTRRSLLGPHMLVFWTLRLVFGALAACCG